jgi:hypothetical protein
VVSSAHALKGSVGLFAQAGAFDLARQLERVAKSGDLTSLAPLSASLAAEMGALDAALRDLRQRLD